MSKTLKAELVEALQDYACAITDWNDPGQLIQGGLREQVDVLRARLMAATVTETKDDPGEMLVPITGPDNQQCFAVFRHFERGGWRPTSFRSVPPLIAYQPEPSNRDRLDKLLACLGKGWHTGALGAKEDGDGVHVFYREQVPGTWVWYRALRMYDYERVADALRVMTLGLPDAPGPGAASKAAFSDDALREDLRAELPAGWSVEKYISTACMAYPPIGRQTGTGFPILYSMLRGRQPVSVATSLLFLAGE